MPVPPASRGRWSGRPSRLDPAARTALLVAAASGGELALVLRAVELLGIESAALERWRPPGWSASSMVAVLFRHPLVRSSVYAAAEPAERRAVHRALVAVLPDHDLERRAWHLAEAAAGPDDRRPRLLERVAVRATSRSADAVAATAFERAAG